MNAEDSESATFETKKRKLLLDYEKSIKKKGNIEVEEIETPDVRAKIIPVLSDEYFRSIETERMFVGKITIKKETSRLIRELSSIWPLEGKSHLKRVRWTSQKEIFEVLICPVNEETKFLKNSEPYSLKNVVGETNLNTTGLMDDVVILDIPKFPPSTNSQYKAALEFWPVQFRENKYIEKTLNDELFSSEEKKNIVMFMKMSISAAQYGDEKVGCIIVDPVLSKVVAIAHDRRQHHPVQHATMTATDLVARSQGGGSWDIDSKYMYHLPYSKEETDLKIAELKKLNPEKDVKKMCLPYLCTGFDAYISREPCVMCAMALVHSRIRRVFYAFETHWGALGSHCKLHLQDGLNHHYEVWRVKLENGFLSNKNDAE